ncbi:MAG: alpha/beta hydrolase, partial [Tepidisphaeraceae bacterium]
MLPPWLTFAILLASVAILVWASMVWLLSDQFLCPPRMTDGKAVYILKRLSPGDLGLPFEDVRFDVRDQATGMRLAIAGWWIPHDNPTDRCVVMLHGFADAKVGAIAWAPTWQALGYNILAIDLRAHGDSAGRFTTAGYFERHDIDQVINQLRAARPDQTRHLVLFGISLGGVVALVTAWERDDLDAVIADCPFADYRQAIASHAALVRMPGPAFYRPALALAAWRSGANFDAVRPIDRVRRLTSPVLVIHSENDPVIPRAHADAFRSALQHLPGPSEHWLVEGAGHVLGVVADPVAYRQRLRRFLE